MLTVKTLHISERNSPKVLTTRLLCGGGGDKSLKINNKNHIIRIAAESIKTSRAPLLCSHYLHLPLYKFNPKSILL